MLCVMMSLGLACTALTPIAAMAGEADAGPALGTPVAEGHLGPPLHWQETDSWRDLPLLDPAFHTGLAREPLRLYQYSPTLSLAVGRGIVFKTRSGVTREQVRRRFPGLRALAVLAELGEERIYRAEVADATALDRLLTRLRDDAAVIWAQPDVLKVASGGEPERLIQPSYNMDGYSLHHDLQLDAVWAIATGRGVRVAVIDSGVELRHPGLAGVTMSFAYDTESRSPDVSPRRKGDHHGDMVTGLIFANGIDATPRGMAPDATLIAIRLASTWTSDLVLAFQAAYLAKADVINCSWDDPLLLQPVIEVLQQIAHKGRGGRGTLIVVAAGNHALDTSGRPSLANRDEVISVTALDHANQPISAFGSGIDIAAPSMLRTLDTNGDGNPAYLAKTSAAAPVVSATLALMLSANPALTADTARSMLLGTATALPGSDRPAPTFGKVSPLAALQPVMAYREQGR